MDSITSSTDEFLDLPKPPSTVPPEGSLGLLPPAAAAGPRFRPGSRVWCGVSPVPEEGTVGMILSPAGGPGGQAVYKVGTVRESRGTASSLAFHSLQRLSWRAVMS